VEDLSCQILVHGQEALIEEVMGKTDMVGVTDARLVGLDSGSRSTDVTW